jgi:hypothetical protein
MRVNRRIGVPVYRGTRKQVKIEASRRNGETENKGADGNESEPENGGIGESEDNNLNERND